MSLCRPDVYEHLDDIWHPGLDCLSDLLSHCMGAVYPHSPVYEDV